MKPDSPRLRFIDARVEVLHQVRSLGLSTLSEQQIDLCTVIMFASWLDADTTPKGEKV